MATVIGSMALRLDSPAGKVNPSTRSHKQTDSPVPLSLCSFLSSSPGLLSEIRQVPWLAYKSQTVDYCYLSVLYILAIQSDVKIEPKPSRERCPVHTSTLCPVQLMKPFRGHLPKNMLQSEIENINSFSKCCLSMNDNLTC